MPCGTTRLPERCLVRRSVPVEQIASDDPGGQLSRLVSSFESRSLHHNSGRICGEQVQG